VLKIDGMGYVLFLQVSRLYLYYTSELNKRFAEELKEYLTIQDSLEAEN